MSNVEALGYAKLNLFLDVVGVKDGYHMLESVACTIDLFDEISVSAREDNEIHLFELKGLFQKKLDETNNAFKSAKLFQQTFNTRGVNVFLRKNIPIGSGMGGSSADISATLKAMAKLFNVDDDLKPLADQLGSDSGYLLTGGFAKLCGRGEIVENLDVNKKLYFVIVTDEDGVNTTECFNLCDSFKQEVVKDGAEKMIDGLMTGQLSKDIFYNALTPAAIKINEKVGLALQKISELSPIGYAMSGSGSSVFGVFDCAELCLWARGKLRKHFKKVIVTESLSLKELQSVKKTSPYFKL